MQIFRNRREIGIIHALVEIPANIFPHDVTIIICTLAALVPAFIAARTEPAVALRD